jgi:ABC-type uncharacterized transport system substrate-binding protein
MRVFTVAGGILRISAHSSTDCSSELVAAAPQVILAGGTPVLAAVREATKSIPIVFVGVSDPEGSGVVESLSRPGGNITGFAKAFVGL